MKQPTGNALWNVLENIGKSLKSKRLADVFRFVSFYPAQLYGPHQHRRIEINYIKKGSCILHLDHEKLSFREGEMMIILPDANHTFEAGADGTTLMQLEFLPEVFYRLNTQEETETNKMASDVLFAHRHPVIKIVNNILIMRIVQRIVNELQLKNSYYKYLVIMYYAELLILIYRHIHETWLPLCTNELLKKAVGYIRSHYPEPLTITEVATHAEISERYLRKLFSRHLGLSPVDYLNRVRINKAVELLGNTEMSVKEISFVCGFASPQYFSRVFKRQTGITPGEATK